MTVECWDTYWEIIKTWKILIKSDRGKPTSVLWVQNWSFFISLSEFRAPIHSISTSTLGKEYIYRVVFTWRDRDMWSSDDVDDDG